MTPSVLDQVRPFVFEQDTFAFANELVWQYQFDPATGKMTNTRTVPPPSYAHRCFVMVRSARQFFYHAQFDPSLPEASNRHYAQCIRAIVARSPRRRCLPEERIVIPGFSSLREFSREHHELLKANCGGAWQSYFLRSHWRMVFPISRAHQARILSELQANIENGGSPIVHLVTFPQLTINHGILLFGKSRGEDAITFEGYDPNIPERPVKLNYAISNRTFQMPATHYWGGGPLNVIHVYQGWFY